MKRLRAVLPLLAMALAPMTLSARPVTLSEGQVDDMLDGSPQQDAKQVWGRCLLAAAPKGLTNGLRRSDELAYFSYRACREDELRLTEMLARKYGSAKSRAVISVLKGSYWLLFDSSVEMTKRQEAADRK